MTSDRNIIGDGKNHGTARIQAILLNNDDSVEIMEIKNKLNEFIEEMNKKLTEEFFQKVNSSATKITQLENKDKELEPKINTATTNITSLNGKVSAVETSATNLRLDISRIDPLVTKAGTDIASLTARIVALENK